MIIKRSSFQLLAVKGVVDFGVAPVVCNDVSGCCFSAAQCCFSQKSCWSWLRQKLR